MRGRACRIRRPRLTRRSGTTMIFLGVAPSSARAALGAASARLSSVALSVPLGTMIVSRSLPITCTAMVTSSSTSKAGSTGGPHRVRDQALATHLGPGLFGQMRRHRRDEQRQRANRGDTARGGRGLLDGVDELVELGHGLVERKRLDVLRHAVDGLVELAVERLVLRAVSCLAGLPQQAPGRG